MKTILKTQQEEYKQTELGLLPKEWKVVRLGDIFTEVDKKTRRTEIFPEENYKIILTKLYAKGIQLKEIKPGGKISAKYMYVIKDGDFIFSKINLRKGAFDFVPSELSGAVVSTEHPILKLDRQKANQQYVKFYFSQPFTWELFKREAKGFSGKERIKVREFMTVKIPFPPLQEQKAIAFVLSTIQTAKEKTEQVIQATKELKKSLMKHLFTYGPVSLKDAEKVKLKETEIGKIPEGWEIKLSNKVFPHITDGTHDTPKKLPEGIPLVKSKQIKNGKIDRSEIDYYISQEDYEFVNKRSKVDKYDLLFSMIGTLGEVALINEEPDFAIKNVGLFKTNKNYDLAVYCYYWLQSKFIKRYVIKNASGTSQKYITLAKLRNLPILFPPLQIQKKIASILSAVDEKIEKEENKKKALEELFKSMLYNLMSAKIRVKDLVIEK